MNTLSVRFLSAALMTVVFVCGFLAGRLTAPTPLAEPAIETIETPTDASLATSRRVMRRYIEDLDLTREQSRQLRPLFESTGKRMVLLPKNSEDRLRELERFHKEMDPVLSPEQRIISKEILDRAREMKQGKPIQ